ncbi:MAG: ornithine cyclodeaminase [Paracoccaceae bacterium]|nr:ornithine cyclodeaminase [Paracoccaceae bacterium]
MNFEIVTQDAEELLSWHELCDAMAAGHKLPKAEIKDSFLYRGKDTILSRAAWIDGLGALVKTATIFPDNPASGRPMVGGAVSLLNDETGDLDAVINFHLVTKWKTVGDSMLGCRLLAHKDARKILIVGAGTQGRNLIQAHRAFRPDAEFTLWNRTHSSAQKMADEMDGVTAVENLETAVGYAEIISAATMTTEPIIRGEWLQAGQHVDLIGAYRPDMREVDDLALQRSRIFVDSFDTTLDHIGELKIPLANGAIKRDDVIADYYNLDKFVRDENDITLFKNGGGAHLDLMVSTYILNSWRQK